MFQNERFCTCGVNEEVPIVLQCMMWNMVDTMEVESKDYFQVFELSEYLWSFQPQHPHPPGHCSAGRHSGVPPHPSR